MYRELNAPELVKKWRSIVNDNVNIGRDAHIIKEKLLTLTPVQILLGIYWCREHDIISIPSMFKMQQDWLEEDEAWAEVELALVISNTIPVHYYIYKDMLDIDTPDAVAQSLSARMELRNWAERILS